MEKIVQHAPLKCQPLTLPFQVRIRLFWEEYPFLTFGIVPEAKQQWAVLRNHFKFIAVQFYFQESRPYLSEQFPNLRICGDLSTRTNNINFRIHVIPIRWM